MQRCLLWVNRDQFEDGHVAVRFLVGEDVGRGPDRHAKRVGGSAVDCQAEFRWLFDRFIITLPSLPSAAPARA